MCLVVIGRIGHWIWNIGWYICEKKYSKTFLYFHFHFGIFATIVYLFSEVISFLFLFSLTIRIYYDILSIMAVFVFVNEYHIVYTYIPKTMSMLSCYLLWKCNYNNTGYVVLTGDPVVGKSAIVQVFHSDCTQFPKNYTMVCQYVQNNCTPTHSPLKQLIHKFMVWFQIETAVAGFRLDTHLVTAALAV